MRSERSERSWRAASRAPGGGGAPAGAAGGCACEAGARARHPRRQQCAPRNVRGARGWGIAPSSAGCVVAVRAPQGGRARLPCIPARDRSRSGCRRSAAGAPQASCAYRVGPRVCPRVPLAACAARPLRGRANRVKFGAWVGASGARGRGCGRFAASDRGAANLGALPPAPDIARAQHRAGLGVPSRCCALLSLRQTPLV